MLQSQRRAHARIAAGLFAGLGVQVGAWAVLIPELVVSRDLTPAELGAALAVMAAPGSPMWSLTHGNAAASAARIAAARAWIHPTAIGRSFQVIRS